MFKHAVLLVLIVIGLTARPAVAWYSEPFTSTLDPGWSVNNHPAGSFALATDPLNSSNSVLALSVNTADTSGTPQGDMHLISTGQSPITFSFQLFMPADFYSNANQRRIFVMGWDSNPNPGPADLMGFMITNGSNWLETYNTNAHGWQILPNPQLTPNSWMTISQVNDGTYTTVYANGTQLGFYYSPYPIGHTDLTKVSVEAVYLGSPYTTMVDNVTIVPEPGSLALLTAMLCMGWQRPHRS